jgi:glycerophosphoryl diester phosphodiesterase
MNARIPLVIAHRGASAVAPENTVEAFRAAADLGADWVELDVHLTDDGVLAVHHDYEVEGLGPIAERAFAVLPRHVPTLPAALEACGSMGVNVEVKADAEHPASDAFLAAVVDACRAWGGTVLVSSFDPRVVDALRGEVPTAQLTFLPDRPAAETVAWVAGRGHRAWHPWVDALDEAAVRAAQDAGLLVNTWTVDDPARIAELASWGVDGIVTNDVARCRGILAG